MVITPNYASCWTQEIQRNISYYNERVELIVKMATFPAYGMAGIGIAAAIGFVFALTLLSSNPAVNPELTNQPQDDATSFRQASEPDSSAKEKSNTSELVDGEGGSAQLMMQQDGGINVPPALASITALDAGTGQLIGEVAPGMVLDANQTVIIRANFVNQNAVANHLITLAISKNDTYNSQSVYDKAANLRGNIGADSNLMLELYWNPSTAGGYTVILLTTDADGSEEPIAEIPIRVVEAVTG